LWRLGLVLVTAFAFVSTLLVDGLVAARLLSGLLCLAAILALWRHIQRTNVELARFIDAVRFGDFSQSFSHEFAGTGFDEVGAALEEGMRRLRDERHRLIDANRFYEAVLDDAPVALLTVDGQGRVELANKAARRLFTRHGGIRIEDFSEYGPGLVQTLTDGSRTGPRLVPLLLDGVPQATIVSTATVHRLDGTVRAIAVQPIQQELNAVEVAAQSDLIRVLTHEIMNSMTPVTSLGHTAAELLARADRGDDQAVSEARVAVETLSRRADGVMHFVESYRQISRRPQVRRRSFAVRPWAEELESLFRASEAAAGVPLSLAVEPSDLVIDADPDLLHQLLLNLLRNAAEASAAHAAQPAVALSFSRTRGGRTQIEVSDNGPGVPPSLAQDVFLPFFTTKAEGTGVGLSLTRQLVLAHGGSISVDDAPGGGALFRIVI
jgi:nitrogen fixation/metabolism regulation signal transduction histidine kinase